MKNLFKLLFVILVTLSAKISREELVSIENKDYLTNLTKTVYGIIATTN